MGIVSIVRYLVANWGVDSSRVFVTGTSSGAMMTNVLMEPILTSSQLDLFTQEAGIQGFNGTGPKVQFWHGTEYAYDVTFYLHLFSNQKMYSDTALYPQNFWEEIKQWTNVFGVSQTPRPISAETQSLDILVPPLDLTFKLFSPKE